MENEFFTGFVPDTIDFMWQLRLNNNKEFLDQNRQRYKTALKEPMALLANELNQKICAFKNIEQTVPVVSRINRDIRFSKNKAPYKENKWVIFKPISAGHWRECMTYYFELTPNGYEYGMGISQGQTAYMNNVRKKIEGNICHFEGIIKEFEKQNVFHLEGQEYKRMKGNIKSDTVRKWFQKKELFVIAQKPLSKEVFSHELVDRIEKDFRMIYTLYSFFQGIHHTI